MARHGENIRKRKDGRWEGRYKVFHKEKNKYIYRSVYGHVYEDVKEKLYRAKSELMFRHTERKTMPITAGSSDSSLEMSRIILFSETAEEWLKKIAEQRKYSTYIKYSTVYKNHIFPIIGSCLLSSMDTQILQEKIFDHMAQNKLSESLKKSICCIINQVLDFANKKYFVQVSLIEKKFIKTKKKNTQTLSRGEQARLLGSIYQKMDKFKIAVLLCLYTGLRLGELCSLQWKDFDFKGMTLTVNRTVQRIAMQDEISKTILLETEPKSESSKRIIPLNVEIMNLICRLRTDQIYVFGSDRPLEPRTMQYQFKKMLKKAEVEDEDKSFHILRHTFATNCIENEMDVKSLSEILGHSDVKITLNRYVHPTMHAKKKQMKKLLDFYGQICGFATGKKDVICTKFGNFAE